MKDFGFINNTINMVTGSLHNVSVSCALILRDEIVMPKIPEKYKALM